jgi:hypothetical protein
VALAFVKGVNNEIRDPRRRSCGLCDEGHLRFKTLTCMVPAI